MAETTPTYDLMLLLRASLDEEQRAQIRADIEQMVVDQGGVIELTQEWGVHGTAYEIGDAKDAEYYLLQFTGPPEIVAPLSYNLKITDGILRHRIIKVEPGMPTPLDPVAEEIPGDPAESAA